MALASLMLSVRTGQQYESGAVLRPGPVQGGVRPHGPAFITPAVDRLRNVNVQVVAMSVSAQDGITEDNVIVRVDAVVYFRGITARHLGDQRGALPTCGRCSAARMRGTRTRPSAGPSRSATGSSTTPPSCPSSAVHRTTRTGR